MDIAAYRESVWHERVRGIKEMLHAKNEGSVEFWLIKMLYAFKKNVLS